MPYGPNSMFMELGTLSDFILLLFGLQGLFRVAPSASKLKKLKAALDCCVVDVQEYSADPHAIAGRVSLFSLSDGLHNE